MKLLIFSLLLFSAGKIVAQAPERLAPDQNPQYKVSLNKYSRLADSLTKNEGVTLQQTYKAYDWYEAKQERRQQRRSWSQRDMRYYRENYWFNQDFYYPYHSYQPYRWASPSLWFNYRWNLRDRYRHYR